MIDLSRILKADRPVTLAGAPAGFVPWLAADLARAPRAGPSSSRRTRPQCGRSPMPPIIRAGAGDAELPGLGLPALRPLLPFAASIL
jgi:hypothetical protein